MLYPKPIIIAVCCAVAIIFGFYLLGKYTLEKNSLQDVPPVTTSEHGTNGPSMTHSISTRDSQSKEGPPQETPEPHVHTHTESHHHPAVTHSEDGTTSQTSAVVRYTEGPYKGMTYEQALKVYE